MVRFGFWILIGWFAFGFGCLIGGCYCVKLGFVFGFEVGIIQEIWVWGFGCSGFRLCFSI